MQAVEKRVTVSYDDMDKMEVEYLKDLTDTGEKANRDVLYVLNFDKAKNLHANIKSVLNEVTTFEILNHQPPL